MGTSRRDIQPVSQEVFLMLKNWLFATWNEKSDHPEIGKSVLKKELPNVKKTLTDILFSKEWPQSHKEYLFFKFPKISIDSAQTRASSFNRCMKVACRENQFRGTVRLSKEGDSFRLAWFRSKRESSIRHVHWLQLPSSSDFDSLLMLGAFSMAKEFKLQINNHFVNHKEELPDRIDEIIKQYRMGCKSDTSFRKSIAVVFDMFDNIDVEIVAEQYLAGVHVVNTGVSGAHVTQDNNAVGRLLAKTILDSIVFTRKPRFAILVSAKINFDRTLGDRMASFEWNISEGLAKRGHEHFLWHTIEVDYDSHSRTYHIQQDQYDRLIEDHDIIVISQEDLTKWLMTKYPSGTFGNAKLFAMDISPESLSFMLQPNSSLEGMVGIDPFSYGRLIIRAAFDSKKKTRFPSAKPIVVTQQDIHKKGIWNYAQFLMSNCPVE